LKTHGVFLAGRFWEPDGPVFSFEDMVYVEGPEEGDHNGVTILIFFKPEIQLAADDGYRQLLVGDSVTIFGSAVDDAGQQVWASWVREENPANTIFRFVCALDVFW
jgi:hypothetical protein